MIRSTGPASSGALPVLTIRARTWTHGERSGIATSASCVGAVKPPTGTRCGVPSARTVVFAAVSVRPRPPSSMPGTSRATAAEAGGLELLLARLDDDAVGRRRARSSSSASAGGSTPSDGRSSEHVQLASIQSSPVACHTQAVVVQSTRPAARASTARWYGRHAAPGTT